MVWFLFTEWPGGNIQTSPAVCMCSYLGRFCLWWGFTARWRSALWPRSPEPMVRVVETGMIAQVSHRWEDCASSTLTSRWTDYHTFMQESQLWETSIIKSIFRSYFRWCALPSWMCKFSIHLPACQWKDSTIGWWITLLLQNKDPTTNCVAHANMRYTHRLQAIV